MPSKMKRSVAVGLAVAGLALSACGGGPVTRPGQPQPPLDVTQVGDTGQGVEPPPVEVAPDATALQPALPSDGISVIAFVSDFNGADTEIYTIEPLGQNLLQLTDNDAQDFAPAWSPDGSKLAFHSDRDGNNEIYIMGADGANVTRVTNDPASDSFPAWSPDGARLAFVSTRGGQPDVWVITLVDGSLTQLTNDSEEPSNLDWSPDGTRIAFTSFRGAEGSVRIAVADTPGTPGEAAQNAFYPDWSPASDFLVYYGIGPEGPDIFMVQANGSNLTPITIDPAPEHSPSLSPDGTQVVFVRSEGVNADLWIINLDGTGAFQLTQGLNPLMPRWSP